MLRGRLTISALAYDVVWEYLGLQDKPNALDVPSPGATWRARTDLVRSALDELHRRGLIEHDEPDAALVAALRLVAWPEREIYGWYSSGGPGASVRSVLCACSGDVALLAHLGDDLLTIEPVRPTALPAAVADHVPAAAAMRIPSYTLPTNVIGSPSPPEGLLRPAAGPSAHPLHGQVRRLLTRPRTGWGQFFAADRDRHGMRRRCEFPLTYVDTADGRFCVSEHRQSDGRAWLVFAAADQARLAARLDEL